MATSRHHLIVGAGTAGLAALEAIRRWAPDDPVTLVSAEPERPYSPTVLPHLLAGRLDESQAALRPDTFFESARCRLLLGKEATGIDAARRCLSFADGSEIAWDTLLLATGSEPLVPSLANPREVELLTFTRLPDLRRLRARLRDGCRVAILGAGLIGTALAEALVRLARSIRVTVIEQERQVLPRAFGERLAAGIAELFQTQGVGFRLGVRAVALEQRGTVTTVTLSDGRSLETDLVVSCVGVKPRTGRLAGAWLASRRGVLVDRRMATSLPDVYAAGDVAAGPSVDGEHACHPVLPTAAAQGRVAGTNMAGRLIEHEGWLAASVFAFFGQLAISVGATAPRPGLDLIDREMGPGRAELLFDGERLAGASFLGVPADPGALAWLVRTRVPVRAQAALLLEQPLPASRWLAARAQRDAA